MQLLAFGLLLVFGEGAVVPNATAFPLLSTIGLGDHSILVTPRYSEQVG